MNYVGVKYKLVSSKNFEEYMKYLGIGLVSRKTALSMSPVCCLLKNSDGTYTYCMSTVFKSSKTTFTPDEEFSHERLDGDKTRTTVTLEPDKLIEVQIDSRGILSKHVREFSEDKLVVTTTAEGWDGVCVRTYEVTK